MAKQMRESKVRVETPFQKIPDASRTTGLSQYYLRKGCKEGTVPHIKSGGHILCERARSATAAWGR